MAETNRYPSQIEPSDIPPFVPIIPPPALNTLMNSNTLLGPREQSSVQGYLSRIQERLYTVNQVLADYNKERVQLEHEHAKYTYLLSPIRRFPLEILCEIFQLCAESWWKGMVEYERNLEPTDKRTKFGWSSGPMHSLPQVCRSWRAAALSCSTLWSYIYLSRDVLVPRDMLLKQLELSKSRSLRIHTAYDLEYESHRLFFQHIVPISARWSSFSTAIPAVMHLVGGQHITLPLLVSLSITFDTTDHSSTCELSAADVPLLTDVSIRWLKNCGTRVELPWAQLRRLQLFGSNHEHGVLGIIRSLRDVEELNFSGICPDAFPLEDMKKLLPLLHYLILSNDGASTMSRMFDWLNLPALESLVWSQICADDAVHLERLLRRSFSSDNSALLKLKLDPQNDLIQLPTADWDCCLDQVFGCVGPHVDIFEIEYPMGPSYHTSGLSAELVRSLSVTLNSGFAANLRIIRLQGLVIDSSEHALSDLLLYANKPLDIRLLQCAFCNYTLTGKEALESLAILDKTPPVNMHLQLEIQLRISHPTWVVYDAEHGLRLERR